MLRLMYFGQSCFLLRNGKDTLLFDPYLSQNPAKVPLPGGVRPDYILVTHGHADHVGDTVELAKRFDACVITTAEMGRYLGNLGCRRIESMHIGGWLRLPFGQVKAVQAFHGCGIPGGIACGFLVKIDGITVYFAGDTGLFGDMRWLGEYNAIDYALLPIGDRFTMGPEDASIAAGFLRAKYVIPMHYNSNARTRQDPKDFAARVREKTDSEPVIMDPGEEIVLEKGNGRMHPFFRSGDRPEI